MDVSLKEYIEQLVHASDRRYEERFLSQEKAVREALSAQEKAVSAALAAAEKAVAVAETNAEKWRANANEWRKAMDDREREFLSKGMGYVVGAVAIVSGLLSVYVSIN